MPHGKLGGFDKDGNRPFLETFNMDALDCSGENYYDNGNLQKHGIKKLIISMIKNE